MFALDCARVGSAWSAPRFSLFTYPSKSPLPNNPMNNLLSFGNLSGQRLHGAPKRLVAALAIVGATALTVPLSAQTVDANPAAGESALARAGTGVISGTVNNQATGNLLAGAVIEVPALGRSVLTDQTGFYSISGVPEGEYEVVVSYTGLDPVHAQVQVASGQRSPRNFNLTSDIYQLPQLKVTGEREGSALALTAQRNAGNVKNVVATDSFGNLPNMSPGELAIRLPGVAGALDDEGNVSGIIVRGMAPTMNRVTIDGGLIANAGGMNRQFQTQNFSGAMFEQLELTKGHTPDQSAESLGGTINLKTRSPLSIQGKRRVAYSFAGRWAPPFMDHLPLRRDHPLHPLFNVAYQEVFDVAGGERNLGVAINTFYSETANAYFLTTRDYQNSTNLPGYLWDYRTQDAYNNRQQYSLNAKFDYRWSPTTKFSLNTIYNDGRERRNPIYQTRAYTGNQNTVPNDTTSGIIPGFTSLITSVRPVAASTIDVTQTTYNAFNRTRAIDFGVEHDFGPLDIDYTVAYNQMHLNLGSGGAGVLTNRLTGVGWILDRTESDLYPKFTQTGGPDMTDPNNYLPGVLSNRNNARDVEVSDLRANASYELPTSVPIKLKTGFQWREQVVAEQSPLRRWNYIGTGALPSDPSLYFWDRVKTGRNIPQWEVGSFMNGTEPASAALWKEDLYYAEAQKYVGNRQVTEVVTSGYVMGQGKVGPVSLLTGVRIERTEDESWGWVRAHSGSTAAEQLADPVGSAKRDYANTFRKLNGRYTDAFPSAHLTYDIKQNLKARLSWSNSFGRPALNNLTPNESFSDVNQTLSVSNPSLLPQYSENWDATLDYYFEPVGNFSVGWFHKRITDYIVTGTISGTVGTGPDNGYDGEYAGYTILRASNAGTAFVQGWELSYQQQLTFLPGLFKGLAVNANYTRIATHGNFGESFNRGTNEVVGFIPEIANLSLSWRYKGFTSRLLANYTGDYINAYARTTPGRNEYRQSRTTLNVGLAYEIMRNLSLTCDIANLTNEPTVFYRYDRSQMARTFIYGTAITFGVSGRF